MPQGQRPRGRQITRFIVNIILTSNMDKSPVVEEKKLTKPFISADNPVRLLGGVVVVALILGISTGYILSNKGSSNRSGELKAGAPKTAQQDIRTFRDFAEGTLRPKPEQSDPAEYVEGTHFLERAGATPVALTSSVVDLSKYEGKKVKVFGETQKALKEGWLMDVGKVEEIK